MSRFLSSKYDSAVDDLLSQAKDHYVLEQVAKINCSGFTDDDSALTINLETRFRRLKSLAVSRPDPALSSSSKKLILSHSTSTSSQKNHGKTQDRLGSFSESSRRNIIGSSSSSRFSRGTNKISSTTTQQSTLKYFIYKEKSRISSSSSSSSSHDQDKREGMKWKSKSRSWFDKLSLAQAMGCLPLGKSSSSHSKQDLFWQEELEKAKELSLETERIIRKANKVVTRSKSLRSDQHFINYDNLHGNIN